MKYSMTWRVYGAYGHRQGESFNKSYTYDFSNEEDGTRIIKVKNYDKTGTHDYSEVTIIRNSRWECIDEFEGQISDGIFENYNTGREELVKEREQKNV